MHDVLRIMQLHSHCLIDLEVTTHVVTHTDNGVIGYTVTEAHL